MQYSLSLLASAGTTMAASFASVVLDQHNAGRALHGSPALTWSDELAGIAQGHVNKCLFQHQVDGVYGQNLAMTSWTPGFPAPDTITTAGNMVAGSWYGEVVNFDQYGVGNVDMTDFESWGHFTQLVWRNTFEVGCAMALCDGGSAYILECNYRAPGNVGGQYAENVPRPL